MEQVRGNERDIFSGTLLSTTGGLVLREPSGSVRTLAYHSGVQLPNLPGRYSAYVQVNDGRGGFARQRIDFSLKAGAVTETVTVTANSVQLETESSDRGQVITK